MNKFDKWWYEFGGGYATPGGDEEDAARYAWESALDAAVEAVEGLKEFEHPPSHSLRIETAAYYDAIQAINKLRSES